MNFTPNTLPQDFNDKGTAMAGFLLGFMFCLTLITGVVAFGIWRLVVHARKQPAWLPQAAARVAKLFTE